MKFSIRHWHNITRSFFERQRGTISARNLTIDPRSTLSLITTAHPSRAHSHSLAHSRSPTRYISFLFSLSFLFFFLFLELLISTVSPADSSSREYLSLSLSHARVLSLSISPSQSLCSGSLRPISGQGSRVERSRGTFTPSFSMIVRTTAETREFLGKCAGHAPSLRSIVSDER